MNVLLVPAHPGFPGQIPQSRKTVVCVCETRWELIGIMFSGGDKTVEAAAFLRCENSIPWLQQPEQMVTSKEDRAILWCIRTKDNTNLPGW